ncbi:MAG: hypothetical protein Q9192_004348 [Flavoplaca navasiana]
MASQTVTLASIPTISQEYSRQSLRPARQDNTQFQPSSALNSKISLIRTSITDLEVTSIVNAANTSLLGGGGVDGAIHAAAGPDLLRECETLDGCDTGSAKITSAYELPSEYVIHAVGPVYGREERKRRGLAAELLASCYTTSLDLAAEKGGSIAFSCLSTGVYGYPSDEAAEVACMTVRSFLESEKGHKLDRVVFCCFLQKDELEYQRVIPMIFPPSEDDLATSTVSIGGLGNDRVNAEGVKSSIPAGQADDSIDDSWVAIDKPLPSAAPNATTSMDSQYDCISPIMEPMPSIEEVHDEGEAMDFSTARKDASAISPVEISSEAGSDTAPLVRSKARTRSRSPYIDQFGLQQPPPPSKLFGGDNLHHITERREYFKEDQALLPFHHDPETYVPSRRTTVSTAGCATFQEAEVMQQSLIEESSRSGTNKKEQLLHLERIKAFTFQSCQIMSRRRSDFRSVEAQMEGLLKEYGFDKMKAPIRKVEGAAMGPYVPYPGRNAVDCQRSAGTLPRKELDETTP